MHPRRRSLSPSGVSSPTFQCRGGRLSRVDENTLSFDGDAVLVGEVADSERLDPLGPLDMSLCAQRPSQWCPTPVTQGEGAGVGGSARLVGRRAQHMVEDQRARTAVNVAGGPS